MSRSLSWTPFFTDLDNYICDKEPRSRGKIFEYITAATGIEKTLLSRYANGKKKPSLETVIRIITAVHPPVDIAHAMIHAAGYDISDQRIKGNIEYANMLITRDIDAIAQLFYAATGNEKYNPTDAEMYPVIMLLHDVPDYLDFEHY